MAKWPTGIDPHGNGIRIRLYAGGRLAFCETVAGDPYKASDLAAAVKRREELAARLALGLPLARGEAAAAALFRDVAQDFLTAFDGAFSTADDYKNIINRHWLPAFGNWMVSDVDTRHIKVELAKLKHLSPKTLKNLMAPLRGVFAYAMDAGLIKTSPAAAIKMKRPQKAHIERWLPAEREQILNRLEGQPLLYFALLFGCGLRPGGEPLGLTWADWDGEQLHVHQQIVRREVKATTKTNVARKVYVPQWVRPLLKNAPTRFAGGPIFVNQSGKAFKDTDPLNYAWRQALMAEGLRYRTPYSCRHTRAAELLSTGVDPGDAAAQLGHTTEMFFRVYSEWIEEFSGKTDLRRFEGLDRPQTVHGKPSKNKS